MRVLRNVAPTPEQLTIIQDAEPGFWLVRGAAGSGKTTTALLRLRFLVRFWRERRIDLGLERPVRVLVLTFNRTLRGYIAELAGQQIADTDDVRLTISTFGRWSVRCTDIRPVADAIRLRKLRELGAGIPLQSEFMLDEVGYVLGRFLPGDLDRYIGVRRDGRGQTPRVEADLRRRLLHAVIRPYNDWKQQNDLWDWNDLAVLMAEHRYDEPYDIVIVDEAQDFSANQIRAVANHLAEDHVTTFIRDTVQRIYPNAYTWREAGVEIPAGHNKRLQANHRNSRQIAAFARPLVEGLDLGEDASLPDFREGQFDGPMPRVVSGRFSRQTDLAVAIIRGVVGPEESVAFLHPVGWFDYLRSRLRAASLPFAVITRESDWPQGAENIALSTMHSAKGLEFDHVFLLGLNQEVLRHGVEERDAQLDNYRRLVAMAVGRARMIVVIGYKPEDPPSILRFLRRETYEAARV